MANCLYPRSYFGISPRPNLYATKQEQIARARGEQALMNGTSSGIVRNSLERTASMAVNSAPHRSQRDNTIGKTYYNRDVMPQDRSARMPKAFCTTEYDRKYAEVRSVPVASSRDAASTLQRSTFTDNGAGYSSTRAARMSSSSRGAARMSSSSSSFRSEPSSSRSRAGGRPPTNAWGDENQRPATNSGGSGRFKTMQHGDSDWVRKGTQQMPRTKSYVNHQRAMINKDKAVGLTNKSARGEIKRLLADFEYKSEGSTSRSAWQ